MHWDMTKNAMVPDDGDIDPRTGQPYASAAPDEVQPTDLQAGHLPGEGLPPGKAAGAPGFSLPELPSREELATGLNLGANALQGDNPLFAAGARIAADIVQPSTPEPAPEPTGAPVMEAQPVSMVTPGVVAPKPARTGGGGGGGSSQDAKLRGDLDRLQADQAKLAEAQGESKKARAGVELTAADKEVEIRQEAARKQAAIEQATDAEIARRQSALDAENQKYGQMGFQDFWSHATVMGRPNSVTGARIAGLVATALGAAGASLTGGRNYAQERIDNLINQDYQRQRDAILKQKDVVAEARFGVEGARQAKADKLLSLENWRKNAYDMVEKQARAQLARMGVPEAEVEKQKLIVDQKEKSLESKMALEKGIAMIAETRASTALKYAEAGKLKTEGAGKPLTPDQAKSADLGGRMLQDNKIINETGPISEEGLRRLRTLAAAEEGLANNPKTRAALVANGTLKTPEQVLNDHDRLAYAARKRFASSVLRGDSGAAISLGEYINFDQQNFEQLGDKPADAAAKRLAREQEIQGKIRAAGPAAADVVNSVRSAPAAPAAAPSRSSLPPGAVVGTLNGQRGYKINGVGKFYPMELAER